MKHSKNSIPPLAGETIRAYRETGWETDPEGMYTGVIPMAEINVPTEACAGGKVYRNPEGQVQNEPQASRMAPSQMVQLMQKQMQPMQDADDL